MGEQVDGVQVSNEDSKTPNVLVAADSQPC